MFVCCKFVCLFVFVSLQKRAETNELIGTKFSWAGPSEYFFGWPPGPKTRTLSLSLSLMSGPVGAYNMLACNGKESTTEFKDCSLSLKESCTNRQVLRTNWPHTCHPVPRLPANRRKGDQTGSIYLHRVHQPTTDGPSHETVTI